MAQEKASVVLFEKRWATQLPIYRRALALHIRQESLCTALFPDLVSGRPSNASSVQSPTPASRTQPLCVPRDKIYVRRPRELDFCSTAGLRGAMLGFLTLFIGASAAFAKQYGYILVQSYLCLLLLISSRSAASWNETSSGVIIPVNIESNLSFVPSSVSAPSGSTIRLQYSGADIGPVAIWQALDPCQKNHTNTSVPMPSFHQFSNGLHTLDLKTELNERYFLSFAKADSKPYCDSGRMLYVTPMDKQVPCGCKSDGVGPTASAGFATKPSSGVQTPSIVYASNVAVSSTQLSNTGTSAFPSNQYTVSAPGHTSPPITGMASKYTATGCLVLSMLLSAFFCL